MIRSIAKLLKNVRAGERKLLWHHPAVASAPDSLELRSDAFVSGATMPARLGGKGVGDNASPPLAWSGAPAGTAEFVLVIEDADAPIPKPFVHGIFYGIAPATVAFPEAALSSDEGAAGALAGKTTFGSQTYAGPRPLPGHGPHTYSFQLLALDRTLSFAKPPSRADLVAAISGAVIARGRLDGTFERV